MDQRNHGQVRYVFIASTMRSGSTMLQHIIGQQPHVLSAGETKIEYNGPAEFDRLRKHLFDYNGVPFYKRASKRWLYLDKVVQARFLPSLQTLYRPDVRFVFLIREPHAALSSLMEKTGWPYAQSVETASWYFCQRFAELVELADELPNPKFAYFLTYEDFLKRTNDHLATLSRFLELDCPLDALYTPQKWTAKRGLGDISENIRAGSVRQNKRRELVSLTETQKIRLHRAYVDSVRQLEHICKGQEPGIGRRSGSVDLQGEETPAATAQESSGNPTQETKRFENWANVLEAHELRIATGLFQIVDKDSGAVFRSHDFEQALGQHRRYILYRGVKPHRRGCIDLSMQEQSLESYRRSSLSFILAPYVVHDQINLVDWFRKVHQRLRCDGVLRLVIKDKRFSGDLLRASAEPDDLLAADAIESGQMERKRLAPYHDMSVSAFDGLARFQGRVDVAHLKPDRLDRDEPNGMGASDEAAGTDTIKKWVFTPRSFAECMAQLAAQDQLPFKCVDFVDSSFPGFDFFLDLVASNDGEENVNSWRTVAAACGEL